MYYIKSIGGFKMIPFEKHKLILLCSILFLVLSISTAFAGTSTHSYDALNRLVQTVITDGSKTTTITHQYDAAGNMTRFIAESETPVTIQSFAADFGRTNCAGGCNGDFNGDGDVDGKDLAVFLGM
jgi:YD repeat-containing protein